MKSSRRRYCRPVKHKKSTRNSFSLNSWCNVRNEYPIPAIIPSQKAKFNSIKFNRVILCRTRKQKLDLASQIISNKHLDSVTTCWSLRTATTTITSSSRKDIARKRRGYWHHDMRSKIKPGRISSRRAYLPLPTHQKGKLCSSQLYTGVWLRCENRSSGIYMIRVPNVCAVENVNISSRNSNRDWM